MHAYDELREVFDVLAESEKTPDGYLLTAVGRLFNHRGIGPTSSQRDVKERIRELAEIGRRRSSRLAATGPSAGMRSRHRSLCERGLGALLAGQPSGIFNRVKRVSFQAKPSSLLDAPDCIMALMHR